METPRFLVILAVGLALAAGCLGLASVLDVPALRFAALGCIVGVFIAREAWMWHGWRWQFAMVLPVVLVVALAFLFQRLS